MPAMALSNNLWFCVLLCVVVAPVGVSAAVLSTTTPSTVFAPLSRPCVFFCVHGMHCVINKCGEAGCVPLCNGVQCKAGEVCRATDNTATCVTNPCDYTKCSPKASNCVVENGSAVCKICPVGIRYQPVCCKLLDGSLKTTDVSDCGCRVSGTALFQGECPDSCTCPPLELAKDDVCCSLPDGSQLSIPDCECKCRLGVVGTPNPTPTTGPWSTTAPTTTYATTKSMPQCLCPETTSGICCSGVDGIHFYTATESCCECLGGAPRGNYCPVIDPLPTQPPTLDSL